MLDAGGCLYQTQPAQANDNMAVSCSARKATANWASLTFGYLDADYQPLKSVEAPIPDANFTNVSATLRAPADTAFVEVMIYAEDSYFEEGMNGWQSCNHGTAMADSGTATSTQEGLYPTIAMTAPVASTYAQVMVYSEGVANLNSCSLQLPANEE